MVAKTPTQAMSLAPDSADKTAIIAIADDLMDAIDEAVSGDTQKWTVEISDDPDDGTYSLTIEDSINGEQTTDDLAFDASAADVQAALRALSGDGLAATVVTESGSTPNVTHTIQFRGTKASITVTATNELTGEETEPAIAVDEVDEFAGKTISEKAGDLMKEHVVDLLEILATNLRIA